jgi:outer membrane protein
MKKLLTLTLLVVAVGILMSATTTQAQALKVGVVRDSVIKSQYKAFQHAQEQWDVEKRAWDSTAAEMQQALQDMATDYEKQKLILSDEKRKQREADIRAKQAALDAFTQQVYGPDGMAQRKNEELLNPIIENVNKAMEMVAAEDGYDLIFTNASGLGYFKPSFDITDKVLAYLEKLEK